MSTTTTEAQDDDQQCSRLDANALLRGTRQADDASAGPGCEQPSLNYFLCGARRQGR